MRLDSMVLTVILFVLAASAQRGASLTDARAFSLAMAFMLGVVVIYSLACLLLKFCKFRLPSGEVPPFFAMLNIALACFMFHSVIGAFLQAAK